MMKIATQLTGSILIAFGAACSTPSQPAATASATPIFNAQGEMAGEASDTSVLLQTRLTSVAGLNQDDVAGAPGVAQFEWSESPEFASSGKTDWMKAVPEHDFIVKKRITGLKVVECSRRVEISCRTFMICLHDHLNIEQYSIYEQH